MTTTPDPDSPLPFDDEPGVTREALHLRRITMRGYRRSDGLYEVEGQVTDRKPREFTPLSGSRAVPAHQPIHDMGVRLVFDADMVVRKVQAVTRSAPYPVCPEATTTLQTLVGLRLASGWASAVRSRLGGARSCTHLMELLMPMATTAIQSLGGLRADRPEPLDANGRPLKIDSCYAYGAERELVLQRWPQFHNPPVDSRP